MGHHRESPIARQRAPTRVIGRERQHTMVGVETVVLVAII
jgi:hypothetical protein